MTQDKGMNLAGVEVVIELQRELERAQARMEQLRREAADLQQRLAEDLERLRRAQRTSMVLWRKSQSPFGVINDKR
jgi:DNA-binding transcriptional MerR regulator